MPVNAPPPAAHGQPPHPPARPKELVAHGDRRVDPWFWLRDRQDPEVLAHLRAENAYTEAALDHLAPLRTALFSEMVHRIEETDVSAPVRHGPWWYYQRTEEGRDYPILCRCPAEAGQPPPEVGTRARGEVVVLDQNRLAQGASYLALSTLEPSPDHHWLAYGVDRSGAERFSLRFEDLAAPTGGPHGAEVSETIPDTSYGGGWASGGAFFYTRLDEAMRPYQVWAHRLGTDPAADRLVFHEKDERFHLGVGRTRSGGYLLIEAHSSVTSEILAIPADRPESPPEVVVPRRHGVEYSVDHHPGDGTHPDGWFVIHTNDGAEDFKVVLAPAGPTDRQSWLELVPHRPGVRLESVDVLAGWLVLGERLEAEPRVRVAPFAPPGGDDDVLVQSWLVAQSDSPGSTWVGANPEFAAGELRVEQTSLVSPRASVDVDLGSGALTVRKRQAVLGDFDPSRYVTFRLWAASADGTRVPISVVHRRELLAEGRPPGAPPATPAPCLLYGYGAYEHSIDPAFSSLRLSLLDRGCIFAVAHVRGGGELGRRWYEEGKLGAKHHTFEDFVAAARALLAEGYTASDRLCARGASAGGLLIGAVANEAPELFGAMVAEVPFVDALTTILDESLPLSVIEWEEWGNPSADPEAYATMRSYSPYDNVRSSGPDGTPVRYPDILATAGLEDPRVGFWEPVKWVARLRQANAANRVLLRVEMGAGHGGPSGRYEAWREEAFVTAFVLDAVGRGLLEPGLSSPAGS